MAFVWNWLAFPGLVAGVIGLALAALVYQASPRRLQNRMLALTLVFEACNHLGGSALMYLTTDPLSVYSWQVWTFVFASPSLGTYLVFLTTLEAPWARALRGTATRIALGASGLVIALVVLLRPEPFVAGIIPFEPYHVWNAEFGPAAVPLAATMFIGMGLLGLALSLNAFFAAKKGTAARERAGIYSIAFGFRDLGYILLFTLPVTGAAILPGDLDLILLPPVIPIVYLPIVTYGILKSQLFDIDLRIKWTLRRGTVAGAFVAVFFIVSELAQQAFSGMTGPVLGVIAAGALVFAMAPLQRVADKIADRAMPHVRDDPEYLLVRKREVYRAAAESALHDGVVTDRERDVLATLADQLGLSAGEARAIEREAEGGAKPAAGVA